MVQPDPPECAAGELVGPYSVIQRLGSGAMGEVYLADDPRLGRRLTLKVLHTSSSHACAPADGFTREARAASVQLPWGPALAFTARDPG